MKSFSAFIREMSLADLRSAEREIDTEYRLKNLDVEFTQHFMNRILDPDDPARREYDQNQSAREWQVTREQLIKLFRSLSKQHARLLATQARRNDAKKFHAVLRDTSTDLNIPVVFSQSGGSNVVTIDCKTIMRNRNFLTRDPVIKVRS